MSNNGKKTLPGVHVPHHKNTNDCVPQVMPVPDKVYISLHMHMGAPCDPLVKKGDTVKVGQLIGSSQAFMSARTHSSVSGTVEAITSMTTSIGAVDQVVVIATDGKQEISEEVQPPVVNNYQDFLEALKCSGLVGLGGAGFPAHVKFNLKDLNAVDTLVINAAECEPYITTDLRTMLDKSDMLFKGIKAVQKYMEINKVYIGIEDNKPQAIEKLRQESANDPTIEVVPLKAMYPKGAEKVIAYETCGKVIKEGQGEIPQASDEVEVIYEGRLIDGTVFDATSKHGGAATDKFRANGLIKGWTEALTLMPVGSKWQLYIPYELAYGERQAGQIPPYSTLVFDLELVSIVKPEVKPEPADEQKEDAAAVKSADKKVVKPAAKKAAHSKKRK